MPKVERLRTWLRRNAAAIVIVLLITPVWAFLLGNFARRWLHGFKLTSIGNRTPTAWDEWTYFGDDWAANATITLVLLIALTTCTRWRFRPLLYAACLLTAGTASVCLMAGIAQRIMSVNLYSGFDWYRPCPFVGVIGAWFLFLAITAWLNHYFVAMRLIRCADAGRGLCPLCRFDLAASVNGVCPECGWTVPEALRVAAGQSGLPHSGHDIPAASPTVS